MYNRVFRGQSFDEIYREMAMTLMDDPDHEVLNKSGHKLYEFVNSQFVLTRPTHCFALCRKLSLKYLRGEMEFYLSGSGRLEDIVKHSKFWEGVSDDGETVNSNYGKLLMYNKNNTNETQYQYAKRCLVKNIESKKAVMVIYAPDNARKSNDNPCTMFLQYVIRENRLHLFVKMRSSDIWFGLPYDVPFFVFMQLLMLRDLRVTYPDLVLGHYHHQGTSVHLYQRNYDTLRRNLDDTNYGDFDQAMTYRDIISNHLDHFEAPEG